MMIRSLRAKLALSHITPTLLLMPILSLYLLYTLEVFYTQSLLQQLMYQAQLLRNEVEREPELIASASAAQDLLTSIARLTDSRVMLLDQDATIIAATELEDATYIGTRFEHPSFEQALRGETVTGVGQGLVIAEVAYVLLPLASPGKGILRLSYEVTDVRTQFSQLQGLVISGIALTIALALGIALALTTTITRPLKQLSERAHGIASGNYHERVTVRGKDEVGELARNFNQMAERLEEAEHARERQLAAIVHELARPLAGMRAAVETLQDGADSEREMRETLLGGVGEELMRLEKLVDTLQTLHRRAIRPIQLNRAEISIERVIRSSVTNFEAIAARAGISLSAEIPDHLPKLRADEDRLIQVLTNLLDNAIKFTPRGGKVQTQVRADQDSITVTVADTGVGITPGELPYVFQQFYSGDASRPPEKRGMGLGLAICRDIITAHQGQIWVESEPGHGARFAFSLPKQ